MTTRLTNIALAAAVLVPLGIAITFISRFAIAAPLTDEWLLVHNAMTLHGAPATLQGVLAALGQMRWVCYTHPVVVPNLIYLAVAPLVHFDARPFIFVTLACNAALLACAGWRGLRGLPLVVAAVLVFSPARYMEMMWGFQFVFGMSVCLGVAGLALLDAAMAEKRVGPLAAGLALIALGALCSAPAAFALPAAVAAYLIRRDGFGRLMLTLLLGGVLVALLSVFVLPPPQVAAGVARGGLFVLTAIGSLMLSSPVGLFAFGLDARSLAGAAILALDAIIIIRAARQGTAGQLGFGIAMVVYGVAAMISIALFRPALGNWHLQCAVPVAVGTLWLVGRGLPVAAGLRRAALLAILLAAVVGYVTAFTVHGPAYRLYAEEVRSYMIASVADPRLARPYPVPFWWDTSPELAYFLAAAGNPDFVGALPPR